MTVRPYTAAEDIAIRTRNAPDLYIAQQMNRSKAAIRKRRATLAGTTIQLPVIDPNERIRILRMSIDAYEVQLDLTLKRARALETEIVSRRQLLGELEVRA